MTAREVKPLRGLLFDLDDTVLEHGLLRPAVLERLYALRDAGLLAVGVTGRPASWGEVLARTWPVDAMVTENGACAWVVGDGRLRRWERQAERRGASRERLLELASELMTRFPELEFSDDLGGRYSDLTFDVGEYRRLDPQLVVEVVEKARALGLFVTLSSVHMHVTLDPEDKATGTLGLLREHFGCDPALARRQFAYVGDSGNDAACFACFELSVGVKNLKGTFSIPPRYQTTGACGFGFCELVDRLLQLRAGER